MTSLGYSAESGCQWQELAINIMIRVASSTCISYNPLHEMKVGDQYY